MIRNVSALALLGPFLLPLGGCGGEAPPDEGGSPPPAVESTVEPPAAPSPEGSAPEAGVEHVRTLAFVSDQGEEGVLVPWTFRSVITPDAIVRHRFLSVARGDEWEELVRDSVATPLSRFPWRILPGGPVRLVVGRDDVIESVGFDDATLDMELLPGALLAEWAPAPASAWRIHRAAVVFPGAEVEGILLDLAEARAPGGEGALDWVFLHAGAATQFLFRERPSGPAPSSDPGARIAWEGWSRVAFQERSWPEVRVRWTRARALDEARRQVPDAWRIQSVALADQDPGASLELDGELRAVRSHFVVELSGSGAQLPVAGFLEVEGEIRIMGERIAVRGLVRHRQW
jgi:hypothetical protein